MTYWKSSKEWKLLTSRPKTAFRIRRFPPLDAYVFVYAPEYAESLSQIMSVVTKIRLVCHDGYKQEQLISLVDDYYTSLASLKANLGRGNHVYDQSKFEEKFGLHWQ
ncbi:hypothetical protein EDC96DRAFT_545454 [Choanephora cucurbitarum]|nr:hypothetical protein EDC96DRAFT_545454 [Choanephora cucurbitarum]